MTPHEIAAFNAGIEAMRQMAFVTAVTIGARSDAHQLRQKAAIAALHGLAEGGKALLLKTSSVETGDVVDSSVGEAGLQEVR